MWLWLCAAALAHPYDALYFGHLLQVRVADDRVLVGYTLELPAGNVRRERRDWEKAGRKPEDWLPAKSAELASGIDLRVDGASARPTVEVVSTTEDAKFVEVQLLLEAPLSADQPHLVEVGNANHPEEQAFFRDEAWVARPWAVSATSLVEAPEGRARRSHQGKWRAEEAARRLVVEVSPRTGAGAIAGWLTAGDGWRPADEALDESALDLLEGGWLPLLLGGAALVGGALWIRRTRVP